MSATTNDTPYEIELHIHRFALWAAARAAQRGVNGLTVTAGSEILKTIGFSDALHPDLLPEPSEIDNVHKGWRRRACKEAGKRGIAISHGIAAKLINVYCKVRFVCAGHHFHPKVAALHPPIDGFLMKNLAAKKVAGFHRNQTAWSKLHSDGYQEVIKSIRDKLGDKPMWMIEEDWFPSDIMNA